MRTFEIEIQELLTRVVKVRANALDEAFNNVQQQYEKAEIVLDYNDFAQVQFIDLLAEPIDDEKKRLTTEVINYLIESEKKHFEEFIIQPDVHIYKCLLRLKELNG